MTLERQLSDLVNQASGLTPDEVALMWHARPAPHALHPLNPTRTHTPTLTRNSHPTPRAPLPQVERLTRELADAETEINDRVFRFFNLTSDEIALLMKEVEH